MFFYNRYSSEFYIYKHGKILKNLLISLRKKSGRSNTGRLIVYGRGGGFKRFYRLIDFKRFIKNIPSRVIQFEYDPNRNIYIMVLLYYNGVITYNLAPLLVKLNMYLLDYSFIYIKHGVALSIVNGFVGSFISCIKLNKGKFKYARAAGAFVQLVRKFGTYSLLRLASKEELFLFNKNNCILGRLSTGNVKLIKKTNAGFFRRLGFKSRVRGVAMNPIDHPHGGGEGRTTAAQPSVSPWGIYTKGKRTSTRFIRKNLPQIGYFKRRTGLIW